VQPLKHFTDDQLIEELVRRRNKRRDAGQVEQWCHDCTNFVAWNEADRKGRPMPDDFNPCTKGHKMAFVTPEDIGDDYGYYRRVCADRSEAA
jgi:hypothetical protein